MKKFLSILLIFALVFSLSACKPEQSSELVTVYLLGKTFDVASNDNSYLKEEYKYSENGNVCECVFFSADGSTVGKSVSDYGQNGRVSKIITYDAAENVTSRFEYEYNTAGDITTYSCYDQNGDLSFRLKYSYQYDKNGKITEETAFEGDLESYRCTYSYDANGRLAEKAYVTLGVVYQTEKFDEKGNMTESVVYKEDGSVSSRETRQYIYDENGNIAEMITQSNGITISHYTYEYTQVKVSPERAESLK